MLLLSLAISIIPLLFGAAVVAAGELLKEKVALLLVGSISGLAAFVTALYVSSLVIPLSLTLIVSALVIVVVATIIIAWRTKALTYFSALPFDRWAAVVFVVCLLLFSIIAPKLLLQKQDGLYTGIVNAYGDVAWHLANITAFAEGQSVPPENPIFADTRLTYPFLANFFSAVLLKSGANYTDSVTLPALLLIPIVVTFIYVLVRDSAQGSTLSVLSMKWAAVIAVLLFVFGGATLGWLRIYDDWRVSEQSLGEFLTHLPVRDYSGAGSDTAGYHFLNPVTSLLLPQRSFLFGLPLAMAIVLLLMTPTDKRQRNFLLAGILIGLLPLFHAHTIVALLPILLALYSLQAGWRWLWFVVPGLVVGLPEVLYYVGAEATGGSFMRWGPGWTAGDHNVVWFWLKNTGFIIPLSLLGLWLPLPRRIKAFGGGAFLIFIVANLWLFAPWAWDNFKLLVYWFLFTLPLVSYTAVYQWQRFPRPFVQLVLVVAVALHLCSGVLDVWKLTLPTATTWPEWDAGAVVMATHIQQVTQPGETILTAPVHNSPVVLAGRPLYLGYPAHVWSHGGNPWNREKATKSYYEGTLQQLPETRADFVLVGPAERRTYPDLTIRPEWQEVASVGEYALYRIEAR